MIETDRTVNINTIQIVEAEDDRSASVQRIVADDPWSMDVLETVRRLGLPDWAIGAGFVRARVWDELTGKARTPLGDVDVLFFDPAENDSAADAALERKLADIHPDVPWSVTNQARMHFRNNDRPYRDTEDALRFWLETPTAVAVRLEDDGTITVLAPLGLDDLFELVVRLTPETRERADKMAAYRHRLVTKAWPQNWPGLRVEDP